jgi:Na+:H+ antiporter, NhaA family
MTRVIHTLRFVVDHYVILPVGAFAAIAWANSRPASYFPFAHASALAVNDAALVVFFALITEELVEATVPGGALHTWRRIALALAAAAGGVAGSALAYLAYLSTGDELSVLGRGWPIPGAVDLAFAYVVARNIWRRHPAIPFVLLIGIASNALGILVADMRYPIGGRHVGGELFVATTVGVAIALARRHFRRASTSVLFDRVWTYPVQVVLFLFALVNAGVMMRGFGTGTKAVAIAALAGKPIGMLAAIGAAAACGLHLPRRVGWRELIVVALTSSIAFTSALFFATAAIPVGPVLAELKVGALLTIAGALVAVAAAALLGVGRFAADQDGRAAGQRVAAVDLSVAGALDRAGLNQPAFAGGAAHELGAVRRDGAAS